MTTKNINVENLISLVQNRPVLWDKTLEIYKDKNLRTAGWREICIILNEDFEEMEEKNRQDYAKSIVKKWTNIRDSWMRSINEKKKSKKSGSSATCPRAYVYHRQMLFLKKIVSPADTHDSATIATPNPADDSTAATVTSDVTHDSAMAQDNLFGEDVANNQDATDESQQESNNENLVGGSKRKKSRPSRQNLNVFDKKMSEFIDYQMECKKKEEMKEDRNLFFFKSLLPSLATLNDNQTLEFQSGVLNLLQNIKNRNEWSPAHSSTYNYQPNVAQSQGYFTSQYQASPESQSIQSNASDLPDFHNM
ncbi:hypothetical protein HF086_008553 [Spodoptera exigua]|uniref:MADF domain-containing protein n=2 Tax=Spodoptera exigua TaxID=7107 RepID=A0A922S9D8_SPOEX|nr:hypothetical protein HF086_008553 [Spodoptera exigua]